MTYYIDYLLKNNILRYHNRYFEEYIHNIDTTCNAHIEYYFHGHGYNIYYMSKVLNNTILPHIAQLIVIDQFSHHINLGIINFIHNINNPLKISLLFKGIVDKNYTSYTLNDYKYRIIIWKNIGSVFTNINIEIVNPHKRIDNIIIKINSYKPIEMLIKILKYITPQCIQINNINPNDAKMLEQIKVQNILICIEYCDRIPKFNNTLTSIYFTKNNTGHIILPEHIHQLTNYSQLEELGILINTTNILEFKEYLLTNTTLHTLHIKSRNDHLIELLDIIDNNSKITNLSLNPINDNLNLSTLVTNFLNKNTTLKSFKNRGEFHYPIHNTTLQKLKPLHTINILLDDLDVILQRTILMCSEFITVNFNKYLTHYDSVIFVESLIKKYPNNPLLWILSKITSNAFIKQSVINSQKYNKLLRYNMFK